MLQMTINCILVIILRAIYLYKVQYFISYHTWVYSVLSVLFQLEDTYAYYINAKIDDQYGKPLMEMMPVELLPESLQFTAEDFGTELSFNLACVAKGGNAGKVDRLVNEMVLAIKTRLGLTTRLLKAYNQMTSYQK